MDGVLECLFPLGRHVCQALVDNRGVCRAASKFWLAPFHPMHPLEIELMAFLGNISHSSSPPDTGRADFGGF